MFWTRQYANLPIFLDLGARRVSTPSFGVISAVRCSQGLGTRRLVAKRTAHGRSRRSGRAKQENHGVSRWWNRSEVGAITIAWGLPLGVAGSWGLSWILFMQVCSPRKCRSLFFLNSFETLVSLGWSKFFSERACFFFFRPFSFLFTSSPPSPPSPLDDQFSRQLETTLSLNGVLAAPDSTSPSSPKSPRPRCYEREITPEIMPCDPTTYRIHVRWMGMSSSLTATSPETM